MKKMKKMKKMKGGVFPLNDLSNFAAVISMLDDPTCVVELVSDKSLTGWILRLTTKNPYFKNIRRGETGTHVFSIIIKLCIIKLSSLYSNAMQIRDGSKLITKQLLLSTQLLNEAKIQQEIYIKTIRVSGLPVTPAIIYVSVFNDYRVSFYDSNANEQRSTDALNVFLDKLINKCREKQSITALNSISTLKQYLNNNANLKLGLIAMESIDPTFKTFRVLDLLKNKFQQDRDTAMRGISMPREGYAAASQKYENFVQIFEKDINHAVAQIIKTVVLSGKISVDSHTSNILGCEKQRSDLYKTVLLDWERNVDIGKYIQTRLDMKKSLEKGGITENHKRAFDYLKFKRLYDYFITATQSWFLTNRGIHIFNFDEMITLIEVLNIFDFINMKKDNMCMLCVLQFLLFIIFVDCVYKSINFHYSDSATCPPPQCEWIMSQFFYIKPITIKPGEQSWLIIPKPNVFAFTLNSAVTPFNLKTVTGKIMVGGHKRKRSDDEDDEHDENYETETEDEDDDEDDEDDDEDDEDGETLTEEMDVDHEVSQYRFKNIYDIFSKITNAGELIKNADGTFQFSGNDPILEQISNPEIYEVSLKLSENNSPQIESKMISSPNVTSNPDYNKWNQEVLENLRKEKGGVQTRTYVDDFENYYIKCSGKNTKTPQTINVEEVTFKKSKKIKIDKGQDLDKPQYPRNFSAIAKWWKNLKWQGLWWQGGKTKKSKKIDKKRKTKKRI
jgi:hypothetical protein